LIVESDSDELPPPPSTLMGQVFSLVDPPKSLSAGEVADGQAEDEWCVDLARRMESPDPRVRPLGFLIDSMGLLSFDNRLKTSTEGAENEVKEYPASRWVAPKGLREGILSLAHHSLLGGHPGGRR
jgi:hypothetical protein